MNEYGIVLNFRDDPSNPRVKQVQCPICGTWYGQYLILYVPRGLVACSRCMGRGATELLKSIVHRGLDLVVSGARKKLDYELAKLIGWIK